MVIWRWQNWQWSLVGRWLLCSGGQGIQEFFLCVRERALSKSYRRNNYFYINFLTYWNKINKTQTPSIEQQIFWVWTDNKFSPCPYIKIYMNWFSQNCGWKNYNPPKIDVIYGIHENIKRGIIFLLGRNLSGVYKIKLFTILWKKGYHHTILGF